MSRERAGDESFPDPVSPDPIAVTGNCAPLEGGMDSVLMGLRNSQPAGLRVAQRWHEIYT